jgi:hypothetical protein
MDIKIGTITAVEIDWWKSYAWLPHKTISGRWVWLELVYKRRVWVYTGFVDEPETQYGTLFDMLEDR